MGDTCGTLQLCACTTSNWVAAPRGAPAIGTVRMPLGSRGSPIDVSLFAAAAGGSDANYARIQGLPEDDPLRQMFERMWQRFRGYCGDQHAHVVRDARESFLARTWEMRLACLVLDAQWNLGQAVGDSPDICALPPSGPRIWLEATAPQAGRSLNPTQPGRKGMRQGEFIDRHGMLLRLTSAITAKQAHLAKFQHRGHVTGSDAFVIAINGGSVPNLVIEDQFPDIVRAVLPFDRTSWRVDLQTGAAENALERRETVYKPRPSSIGGAGSPVATDFFLQPANAGVSGVLFTPHTTWATPEVGHSDLVFVHNPLARVPITVGSFPCGREYCFDTDDQILHVVDRRTLRRS